MISRCRNLKIILSRRQELNSMLLNIVTTLMQLLSTLMLILLKLSS
jgi:hypothetical protein